ASISSCYSFLLFGAATQEPGLPAAFPGAPWFPPSIIQPDERGRHLVACSIGRRGRLGRAFAEESSRRPAPHSTLSLHLHRRRPPRRRTPSLSLRGRSLLRAAGLCFVYSEDAASHPPESARHFRNRNLAQSLQRNEAPGQPAGHREWAYLW